MTAGASPDTTAPPPAAPRPARRTPRDWRFEPAEPPDGFQAGASYLLRRVLWSRREVIGDDVTGFINPDLVPVEVTRSMRGLPEAAAMVAAAVGAGKRIAIFGDYDADGVTATAVLQRGLSLAGADVITYIPHRVNDGYGLSPEGLEDLHRRGAELVISCDCGTNSVDVVAARPGASA